MRVDNYQAIDIIATDLEPVEVEFQKRQDGKVIIYVHVNGITICRVMSDGVLVKGLENAK